MRPGFWLHIFLLLRFCISLFVRYFQRQADHLIEAGLPLFWRIKLFHLIVYEHPVHRT